MKKLLSIVMSIVLVVGLTPLPAYAAEAGGSSDAATGGDGLGDLTAAIVDVSGITTQSGKLDAKYEAKDANDNGYWMQYDEVTDDEGNTGIVIWRIGIDRGGTDVVVPSFITDDDGDTYPVVNLGYDREDGFSWYASDRAKTVTIPATVKSINNIYFDRAGYDGVIFEQGSPITEMYPAIFRYYQGTSISLPDGLVEIYDNMFEGATKLESLVVPSATKSIGYRAFVNTPKMTSITFNDKLETIGKEAFAHIPGTGFNGYQGGYYYGEFPHVTSLDFPDSLTSIDAAAFRKNVTLSNVSFGTSPQSSNLRTIGERAFFGTNLTSVVIPDSVESIGAEAFSGTNEYGGFDGEWFGEHVLSSLQLGSSQDASQLKFLGARAFAQQPITSVTLPNSLISLGCDDDGYGFINRDGDFDSVQTSDKELTQYRLEERDGKTNLIASKGAFSGCSELETIVWPTQPGLNTVGGFDGCSALSEESVNSIPSWVSVIDDYAFYNCVEPGYELFAPYRRAYATTNLMDITIPATVSHIGKAAFSKRDRVEYVFDPAAPAPVYTLTNPNVTLDWGEDAGEWPWPAGCGYTICYPASASADSDIVKYRAMVEDYEAEKAKNTYNYNFTRFIAYDIMPDIDAKSAELSEIMEPVEDTGTLSVTVVKDRPTQEESFLAAIGVNVAVFDASGKLVTQGVTPTEAMFFANDLPEGTYTVVGFDGNEYFSNVSSLNDFAQLGVEPGTWAVKDVVVKAAESTDVELAVPDLKMSTQAGDILDDGSVIVNTQRLVPDCTFYARASYTMKNGRSANKISVNIPEGMQPVSAHTAQNAYGIGGYDASKHLLTIDLKSADAASGVLYVGLKATVPGSYNISASVASGAVTVPIGSTEVSTPALVLVAPTDELSETDFKVEVYAAPGSVVQFTIGKTPVATTVTTNRVGHGTATLTIPDAELGGAAYLGHFEITATVAKGTASAEATETQSVSYRSNRGDDVLAVEQELSFKHAGQEVYLVRNGKNNDNVFYMAIMASHIRLENQSIWPFTSVFDSTRQLDDTAMLAMKALDGTMLYPDVDLVLDSTEDVGGGVTRYTYKADIPIGDGDDYLTTSEIPYQFEVFPSYAEEDANLEWSASQADVDAFKASRRHTPELWLQSANEDMNRALRTTGVEEGKEIEYYYQFAPQSYKALMAEGKDPEQKNPFDLLFNANYKHEKWDADGKVWNSLTENERQKVLKFEQAMEKICIWWQEFYGDKNRLDSYANMDEYLAEEFGLQTGLSLDPKQLEAEGYQVIYDNNAQAGECTWYAVKHEWSLEEDEVQTQSDGTDGFVMTTQASSQKGKAVKGKGTVKAAKSDGTVITKAYDMTKEWFWGESGTARVKDVFGFAADAIQALDGVSASQVWKDACCMGSKMATYVGGALNMVVVVYDNLITDAPRYWNRAFEIGNAEREIENELTYLENAGKKNSKCYQALLTERSYLQKYNEANSGKILLSVSDTVVTSEMVALSIAGGEGAAVALASSPEAGIAWSAGTYFAGKDLAAKGDAAKNTFERKRIARYKQCGDKKKLKHVTRVGIDPSGYVFEGTEDNRLEGVTATIYQQQEDGTWVKWDAEDWDQVNDQMTGAEGLFGWEVPAGKWKVVFSEDGYEGAVVNIGEGYKESPKAETPALDVPPEWTNIGVGLLTKETPKVVDVAVVGNVATVTFDQPMKQSVAPTVTVNGKAVPFEWVDPQMGVNEKGGWEPLSKTLKVTLPATLQKVGSQKLVVSGGVGYAGKAMAQLEKELCLFKRLFGNIALDTMASIVHEGWTGQTGGTVVLSQQEGYWDALTAAGIAGMAGAPVLMTDKNKLRDQTASLLAELRPATIVVCGGPAALEDSVAQAASQAAGGAKIVRCKGDTATGTAVDVFSKAKSEGFGTWSTTAFVCTNQGYWDALAAAPVSYAKAMPIFLTEDAKDISDETLKAMKSGGIKQVYIVGGDKAIEKSVQSKIEKSGIKVADRLAGETCVETSEAVAAFAFKQGMGCAHMGVATAGGHWDALAGAPLCGVNESVLVLAWDSTSDSVNGFVDAHRAEVEQGYVFGGEAAIDKPTYNTLNKTVK